ncbi:SCAN box domain-containing protein [Trichonephila clavipes]|nr:SCAN box domain-containing protein [Trichonephila clavipes]
MPLLRDTGATLDLICKKYVKPSMFINGTVWIRTLLEETAVCLPMAEVELDCVFGHVITKAAVLRDSLDQGKNLLRNKTAALFEEVKKNKEIQVYMVNAVETRSQKKLTEESKQDKILTCQKKLFLKVTKRIKNLRTNRMVFCL